MQKRKIIIGTYDTALEGLWTLSAWSFSKAVANEEYANVPGHNGPLDLSTALTDGEPYYGSRELEVTLEGDEIVVKAAAYAKSVEIQSPDSDFILSDNFFDMNAGEKRVKVIEGEVGELLVRSVFDIK